MKTDQKGVGGASEIAVITGASSGLGRAFAVELDRRLPENVDFWLIARHEDQLRETAEALHRRARLLPMDLTSLETYDALRKIFREERPSIRFLINNAGEGRPGFFEEEAFEHHRALCDLNVRAQILMTSSALPWMGDRSTLLFTASVAAFMPQPAFATYAASKAMILSFARALGEELRPSGIHVAVTCPNPMLTAFFTREQAEALKNSYKRMAVEDPDVVAGKTLDAARRGRRVIVTSFPGKTLHALSHLVPTSWLVRIIGRLAGGDRRRSPSAD